MRSRTCWGSAGRLADGRGTAQAVAALQRLEGDARLPPGQRRAAAVAIAVQRAGRRFDAAPARRARRGVPLGPLDAGLEVLDERPHRLRVGRPGRSRRRRSRPSAVAGSSPARAAAAVALVLRPSFVRRGSRRRILVGGALVRDERAPRFRGCDRPGGPIDRRLVEDLHAGDRQRDRAGLGPAPAAWVAPDRRRPAGPARPSASAGATPVRAAASAARTAPAPAMARPGRAARQQQRRGAGGDRRARHRRARPPARRPGRSASTRSAGGGRAGWWPSRRRPGSARGPRRRRAGGPAAPPRRGRAPRSAPGRAARGARAGRSPGPSAPAGGRCRGRRR